jgi:hypothetical protein
MKRPARPGVFWKGTRPLARSLSGSCRIRQHCVSPPHDGRIRAGQIVIGLCVETMKPHHAPGTVQMFTEHTPVQHHARAHPGVHATRSSKKRFSLNRRSLEWRLFNTLFLYKTSLSPCIRPILQRLVLLAVHDRRQRWAGRQRMSRRASDAPDACVIPNTPPNHDWSQWIGEATSIRLQ